MRERVIKFASVGH